MLNEKTIAEIKNRIDIELLKRGFLAKTNLLLDQRKNGEFYLALESEGFQTVPVIMKTIKIQHFNSQVKNVKRTDSDCEYDVVAVWMTVYVAYEHFSGGTNCTEIFTFNCDVINDELYKVTIR